MIRNLAVAACLLGALVLTVNGIANSAGVSLLGNRSTNQLQDDRAQLNQAGQTGITNSNARPAGTGTQGFNTAANSSGQATSGTTAANNPPAQPRQLVFPALW